MVAAKFATTAADGKTYQVDCYNLDVIISVGYRVKSQRGTQFRIWATALIKEYRKYRERTLSDVEQDYLNSIKFRLPIIENDMEMSLDSDEDEY